LDKLQPLFDILIHLLSHFDSNFDDFVLEIGDDRVAKVMIITKGDQLADVDQRRVEMTVDWQPQRLVYDLQINHLLMH
jgi:hypothetical protein